MPAKTYQLSLPFVLALGATGACHATQSPDDYFSLSLEELGEINIAVSSVFEETPRSAASTIATIDNQAWREDGARNVIEALANQPGVYVLAGQGGGRVLSVRGYGDRTAASRGHAILLDGIPLNDLYTDNAFSPIRMAQLGTLDRIDMIRGPGSALYGAGAFHDVVNLKSYANGADEITWSVNGASDQYASTHLQVTQNLSNSLRFNMALAGDRQADQDTEYRYTDPTDNIIKTGRRDEQFANQTGIFKLHFTQDNFSGNAAYYRLQADTNDHGSIGRLLGGQTSILRDRDRSGVDDVMDIFSLDGEYHLDKTNSIAFQTFHRTANIERPIDLSRATGAFRKVSVDETLDSALLRLKHNNPNTRIKAAIGVEFQKESIDRLRLYNTSATTGITSETIEASEGSSRNIRSLVSEISRSDIVDGLKLQFGLRYDDYPITGSHTSPRLGLVYDVSSEHTFKYIYGHAFRAPTLRERNGDGSITFPNDGLDPEIIDTHELVWFYQHKPYSASSTLFFSKWQDQITLVTTPVRQYTNLGDSESRGIELQAQWQYSSRLSFGGNFTYTDSENTSLNYDYTAIPDRMFNLNVRYRMPERNVIFKLNSRIYSGVEDATNSGTPSHALDTYVRVDLHAGWQPDKNRYYWLQLINLLDRDNRIAGQFSPEFGVEDGPFSVGVGAGIKF